jgi:hypothetical protein
MEIGERGKWDVDADHSRKCLFFIQVDFVAVPAARGNMKGSTGNYGVL